jgi:drug/metabolite transporter (DMT)-like permease
MTRSSRAWLAWSIVCIVWGTTYLGIRVALESVPPALMAGFRWTVAGTLLTLVLVFRGKRLPPIGTWPGFAMLGLLMIGLGNGLVVWAEQFVPSGLTAVVIATSPFWMVAAEAMSGGERLSRGALVGLLVGFGGIVLLVWPDLRAGGTHAVQFGAGILALQLACIGWAAGSSWAKRHRVDEDDVVGSTAMQMLFGGVLMLAIGTVAGEWHVLSFTTRSTAALVYLTAMGSLGAFVAYIYALRHLPVSIVSLYAYVNPVIAVALGALVLNEPFGARVILAAALVLGGLGIVRYADAAVGESRSGKALPQQERRSAPSPSPARSTS